MGLGLRDVSTLARRYLRLELRIARLGNNGQGNRVQLLRMICHGLPFYATSGTGSMQQGSGGSHMRSQFRAMRMATTRMDVS